MRREGLLTGRLWNKDAGTMVKVKNKPTNASSSSGRCGRASCHLCHDHPVGKARAKTKGRRNKLALSIDEDWPLATTSSRHRDAKVKVSSHALDYPLDDADDIYAACHASDVACGAKVVDHTFDIDAACHAIDIACAFDIEAACHAIDTACAVKINDVHDASDSYVDCKKYLVTDGVVDVSHDAHRASSCDDHDHDDIHRVGDASVHRTIDNYVRVNGPFVDETDDTKYDDMSDACCGSSIYDGDDSETSLTESEGNSLSSGWYYVATLDKDEWCLC